MFGTFRYILAALVLMGHVFAYRPVNVGVAAVVNFFVVSGYVMTLLIRNNYPRLGKPTLYFYADRFLRIFPQYLLYVLITQICLLYIPFAFFSLFFRGEFSPGFFLLNVLIVPVNYFFVSPAFYTRLLVPPAWSLGLEEQFYWLFPPLVFKPWIGRALTLLSAIVFATAVGDFINGEIWGFRLLPGVLFMFMMGKNLADFNATRSKEALWTSVALYLFCVVMLVCVSFQWEPLEGYVIHELIGLVAGYPVIALLSKLPRRKWDESIGHCSYGVFLNHVLIVNLMAHFRFFMGDLHEIAAVALVLSTVASFASYHLVEKFVSRFRMKIRARQGEAIRPVAILRKAV
jgi:peptidoglycan/LPS O-acetylase OafA/YrhL